MSSFQIRTATGNVPAEVMALYETAFPLYERRLWDQQLILLQNRELKLLIIEHDGEFAGFVFYWALNGFVFVEHFALLESMRGKGGGTTVMNLLKEMFRLIVLEVEPAQYSVDAFRRLTFYKRLGYLEFDSAYLQPPYHPGEIYRPMVLMHIGDEDWQPYYKVVVEEIYGIVYGIK